MKTFWVCGWTILDVTTFVHLPFFTGKGFWSRFLAKWSTESSFITGMGHIWRKGKSVRSLHCRTGKGPCCGNSLHVLVPWNECEFIYVFLFGSRNCIVPFFLKKTFQHSDNVVRMPWWSLKYYETWIKTILFVKLRCSLLLLCGYVQLNAAYDALTSKRPCGPNKRAIQGATYDLAKNDPWKEPFENLPEYAFEDMADWERKLIQDRVISLRGTWTLR